MCAAEFTLKEQERCTIYIVDDDASILRLYQKLLRDLDATFKSFTSAREFMESYSPGPHECLICDVRSPETGGLRALRELTATGACPPVIFASADQDVPSIVKAMKAGAFDVLEKPVDSVRLQASARSALEHSRTLHCVRRETGARQARLALLTPKERKIAEWVVANNPQSL